jgi:hypothetical protein
MGSLVKGREYSLVSTQTSGLRIQHKSKDGKIQDELCFSVPDKWTATFDTDQYEYSSDNWYNCGDEDDVPVVGGGLQHERPSAIDEDEDSIAVEGVAVQFSQLSTDDVIEMDTGNRQYNRLFRQRNNDDPVDTLMKNKKVKESEYYFCVVYLY